MKKHIIFDMDGVIVDSEPEYRERVKEFMASRGFIISDELCNQTCGSNRKDSYELFRRCVEGFEMSYEEYYEGRDQVYVDHPLDMKAIVNEDIYPLLDQLKAAGFHIGMASSSPKEKLLRNLDILGLTEYFEIIVSGMEFQRSKPDPEVYFYTMEKMGVRPEDCYVVEDSTYGLQAAERAGAIVICKKDDRMGYDQSGADYYIDRLSEIADICIKED